MTTFVLVGGFWIGAWAWRGVAARLTAIGHYAYPLSLTGLGEFRYRATPEVCLETHVDDVARFILARELEDVVLVGHSGAGAIVNVVAHRLPDRVAGLVFVDSGPVPEGACIADFSGPSGRADTIAKAVDGWRLLLPEWREIGEPSLVGLNEERRAFFRTHAADQPLHVAIDPVRLGGEARPDIRRWAILSTIPLPAVQDMIAGGNPWFAPMGRPEWRLKALATGHWPMLSEPTKLADMLAGWP